MANGGHFNNLFLIAALAAVLSFGWTAPSIAGELRVSIEGARNGSGNFRVALFRTPEDFPKKEGLFQEAVVPAASNITEAVFSDVPKGTYGIAAFHDENDNLLFDKNFVGFPEEGFGFGNDAPVFLGPPDFLEAAVKVGDTIKRVSLTLRYW